MAEHRCDPTLTQGTHNNPLTRARTIRLIQARLDDRINSGEGAIQVLREVQDCTLCLGAMLLMAVGMLGEFIPEQGREAAMAEFDKELAAALDQLDTDPEHPMS